MGAYEYIALNPGGRQEKGLIEGDTPRQVRSRLRAKNLSPLTVVEVIAKEGRGESRNFLATLFQPSLNSNELALVTRQLATLCRSGMPIESALNIISKQTEKVKISRILMAVRARVLEGHSLAIGLAEFSSSFSSLYCSTVGAGEQSGHLGGVLERLADYTEQSRVMRQKIQLALFYPALLTIMALLVTIALMVYVVPQVVQVFDDIGQELPALTQGLIALSDFLREQGLLLLLLILLSGVGVKFLLRMPVPLFYFHRLILRLPIIGRLARGTGTALFTRTFSILSSSGVDILESLRISAEVIANQPMRQAVVEAAAKVREGGGLAAALESNGYFPPMTLSLIASGEVSGNLDEMLGRAADNQELEVTSTIATVMGLFEPLLIMVMGGLVLTIVLAILLPIFDLNQLVR
ncbi:MAG: type II secretion system inner membrane protein GspF [Sedimenticola sp.]